MQLVSLYPYDPTGFAATNKIVNETITVTPPAQVTDYSYVVPRAAPFFAESLVVKDGKTVGARTLVENVDYWCVIDFLSASVGLNKRISVGIALLDPSYSGTLYISYQALGGNYSLADYSVLEELVRNRYVVKHVSYEQIVNLPEGFAPQWHQHEVKDMVGMSQVVGKLGDIKGAVDGRSGSYGQIDRLITNHVNSANAHNPSQVGLSNVKNFGIATLTDATAGSANKYVTADILKQYVTSNTFNPTGYLTTANAELTYAKLSALADYDTRAVADGKYAVKGDTYTKAQVEALVAGVDVSDSFSGFYTKGESDSKYFLKTDIASYIKETIADGRYAKQTDLGNYYTKTQSDANYSPKNALMNYYTKTEADGKYLVAASLTGYLSKTEAAGTYVAKTSYDAAIADIRQNTGVITDLTLTSVVREVDTGVLDDSTGKNFVRKQDIPVLSLTERVNSQPVLKSLTFDFMEKYALSIETPNKANIQTLTNHVASAIGRVSSCRFTRIISYRGYKLNLEFTVAKVSGMIHISWMCKDSFYWDENTPLVINLVGTTPSTSTVAASYTRAHLMSFNQVPITSNRFVDYFFRIWNMPYYNYETNDFFVGISVSTATGSDSTMSSSNGFHGSMSLLIDDYTIETAIDRLIKSKSGGDYISTWAGHFPNKPPYLR